MTVSCIFWSWVLSCFSVDVLDGVAIELKGELDMWFWGLVELVTIWFRSLKVVMMDFLWDGGWCDVVSCVFASVSCRWCTPGSSLQLSNISRKGNCSSLSSFMENLILRSLEFRYKESLRVVGLCSHIANTSSTYLCQHFDFIRPKLMGSSLKYVGS